MDALSIPRAHVCGASIGGMVCIALGALAPARVLSLVIAEAPLRTAQEWAAQWPRTEAMFAIPQQTEAEVAPRFRQLTPALLARWNIDRHKAGGWRMVDVMWALRQFDAYAHLARIAVPCMVLIGDRGPVFASRAAYEKLLPKAPLKVITDAGHFPMLDDPAAFCAALREGIAAACAAT